MIDYKPIYDSCGLKIYSTKMGHNFELKTLSGPRTTQMAESQSLNNVKIILLSKYITAVQTQLKCLCQQTLTTV